MTPTLSKSESDRFGLPVYRVTVENIEQARMVADWIQAKKNGIAIVRIPSGESPLRMALVRDPSQWRHADSLVYYSRRLLPVNSASPESNTPCGFILRRAKAEERAALESLALRCFSSYKSHYSATPEIFSSEKIAAGYAEWAGNLLARTDAITWVAESSQGELAGFISCQLLPEKKMDIVLNAVDPDLRRRGIYFSLLQKTRLEAPDNIDWITVSTQLWNYSVQRAWIRDGYAIEHAYDTYHARLQP